MTWQNIKFLAVNTSLFWDQNQETFPEKVPLPRDPSAWRKPKWIFHNLGNLLRPLELIPASRERAVSTEWQVRTEAHEHRQYVLISDFLYLADLSTDEEAASAKNWIKDRPEGLKLQNLALATKTGRSTGSLLENLTADVHYATNTCESLGSGKQMILHGNPSATATGFFAVFGSPSTSLFAECALPVLCVTSGHPRLRF